MKIRKLLRRICLKVLTQIDASIGQAKRIFPEGDIAALSDMTDGFYLDENTAIELAGTPGGIVFPRWMQVAHCEDKRTSLILAAGESIRFTYPINLERDTRIFIRYSAALPEISTDGLMCEIAFHESDQDLPVSSICILPISGGRQQPYWRVAEIDLSFLPRCSGHVVIRCCPGPDGDPSADWLAISDLCIGREDRLSRLKARSFHELRSRNEIEHFSNVYRHSMYSEMQNNLAESAGGEVRPVRKLLPNNNGSLEVQTDNGIVHDVEPLSGESPYGYASRLLDSRIDQAPPDFVARLKAIAEKKDIVRVLSLCSGAARTEASYAAQVGAKAEWSLLDINPDLLGLASKQFSTEVKLDLIEANVNELEYSGEKWDVILCVSALHHIVELERVIKFCHDSLNEGGEFWSIGEYVGRNGNRLWPDARAEANKVLRQLPERYRLNRHTNQLDHEIPDNDYSVGCFEGVRSEDIEPILDRWFYPEDVYRRNCFLWRLINLAYSDNYDLQKPEDRKQIIGMVNSELEHFWNGGRGTELFGVYRLRPIKMVRNVC